MGRRGAEGGIENRAGGGEGGCLNEVDGLMLNPKDRRESWGPLATSQRERSGIGSKNGRWGERLIGCR